MAEQPDKRNLRSDSYLRQQTLFEQIQKGIEPPVDLDERQLEIFDSIIISKPVEMWSSIHVKTAAQLAKILATIDGFQKQIDDEGSTFINERGNSSLNPAVSAINSLSSTAMQHFKILGLSAVQMGETVGQKTNAKKAESKARDADNKSRSKPRLLA